jgi:hypothetical protein
MFKNGSRLSSMVKNGQKLAKIVKELVEEILVGNRKKLVATR